MQINRRKILSGVMSGGITAMTTRRVQGGTLYPSTQRITTIKYGDRAVKQKEVPTQWWRQLVHTRNVRKTLEENYRNRNAVKDVCIGSAASEIEGRKRPSLVVAIDSSEPDIPNLSDSVEGVPVTTQEWIPPEPDTGACNNNCNEYDPAPGGVRVEATDFEDFPGTSCCPARDSDNNPGLITCAHLWSCSSSNLLNRELLQGSSSDTWEELNSVGEIRKWSRGDDFVFADSTTTASDINIRDDINFSGREVRGYVTENGLEEMKSTSGSDNVKKFGINTGLDTGGSIIKTKKSIEICEGEGHDFVEIDLPTLNGDSGGPYFKTYFDGMCLPRGLDSRHSVSP